MATFIRQLSNASGEKILPATRAEGVYMSDNTTLADLIASAGVVKKAQADKNGKDITEYVTGLSVDGKTVTFSKGDGTSGTITTQDTTYGNASQSAAGLMTAEDKKKLDGVAEGANNYVHPSHTGAKEGLYKVTVDTLGHVTATKEVEKGDITALGIPGQDTTYSEFAGSTAGLVPSADTGDSGKYLKADGTWGTPTDTTYGNATTDVAGLMSAADKAKLDGIAANANNYTHPSYDAQPSGLYKVTVDATGHVSEVTPVVKTDITNLGIPAQDTTYTEASQSKAGLMSAADKVKLDGIATGSLGIVSDWGKEAEDLPALS